jgi:hypothetical protein
MYLSFFLLEVAEQGTQAADVAVSTEVLIAQLHQQLRTNVQLPQCLKIIGLLRRLEVYSESELRINFLKCRDAWLQSMIDTVPNSTPYLHRHCISAVVLCGLLSK